jgi:hypothetical protein
VEDFTLDDLQVRRVLIALSRTVGAGKRYNGRKSVDELVEIYNGLFPPSMIGKIIGTEMSESKMKDLLSFITKEGYASKEVLSFTDRALKKPTPFFQLTHLGEEKLPKKP